MLLFIFTLMINAYSQSPEKIKYLALGDSYTIGESVAAADRWPNQVAASLRKRGKAVDDPLIIATTGWRTDDLKHAIDAAAPKHDYGMVSLLIGVNNQYQGKPIAQYAVEFEELLKMSISLAGGKKENVFVVSIPDYGFTPFGEPKQSEITAAIAAFNKTSKDISERLGVRYVNITDISREGLKDPSLVAGDHLHPSGKMYALWAEKIVKTLMP